MPRSNALPLTTAELRARIAELPRIHLAHLPTPLDFCPRLTRALDGPQIYVKRDDLTGLAFGGNKTRQLEFLFPEILEQKPDTIVVGAYSQSNWCRQITAAAAKLGLKVKLVLVHGEKGPLLQGNLLLDRLMGADVTVTRLEDMHQLAPLLEAAGEELRKVGRRPYVIQPFSPDVLATSAVGYVSQAAELDDQLADGGLKADYIYLAGANITPAGIQLGLAALGRGTKVVSICPIRWPDERAADIATIATAAARKLDLAIAIEPAEVTVDETYIGERYGRVTEAGRAALRLVAECEGIILDPVYSAKAMSGLIDHIKRGRIRKSEVVVFVHTGGNPAVFAYADDLVGG
jgi:L-cysteate sulfo-lyase